MSAAEMTEGSGLPRLAELRDGSAVWIRPIRPDDKELLRRGFRRLSETSRRRRFLAPANELSPEDLAYLTEVDHRRHEALVALDGQDEGELVGVARYVRTPSTPDAGEVAVVVADDWQHRGLGNELMTQLTERARENGLRRYSALVSKENTVVVEALERLGAERLGETENGELEYGIDFPAQGLGERLRAMLSAAASGQLDLIASFARRLLLWRRP